MKRHRNNVNMLKYREEMKKLKSFDS